jgi:hypothetical protein
METEVIHLYNYSYYVGLSQNIYQDCVKNINFLSLTKSIIQKLKVSEKGFIIIS